LSRRNENEGAFVAKSASAYHDTCAQLFPFENHFMAGQGSTGNVIAALCSFFVPGLGQLLQGRLMMAIFQFVLAAMLWFVLLGWLVHLWSILDAALFKPRA
jgi:TM2 domain-containing membrane protein YozV